MYSNICVSMYKWKAWAKDGEDMETVGENSKEIPKSDKSDSEEITK